MPPGFLDATTQNVGFPRGPCGTGCGGIDPVVASMLQQQMLLTQTMVDLMSRSAQSSAPAVPPMPGTQVPTGSNGGGSTERLTMDSKWIPSAPLPEWKSTCSSRALERPKFPTYQRFASWLCLIHDSYAAELKEALVLPYPVEVFLAILGNVIRSQIAFYGIQAANGFELLRLFRKEFSLMSRPEALHYREAALKYTVKKADKHLLLDFLREVGAEIEGFHAMLEASLIYNQISDLRLNEGDQFLLYASLEGLFQYLIRVNVCGATSVQQLWQAVTEYHVRMRMTGDLDKVHGIAEKGKGKGKGNDSEKECFNCGKKGHLAKDCEKVTVKVPEHSVDELTGAPLNHEQGPTSVVLELQKTVYEMGGQETFESRLFRISTKKGFSLILVYVDDLLVASHDEKEGEEFLRKLMGIWKIKLTGKIPALKKGVLQFLGRTIYRERDGPGSLL
eukprot:s1802_g22.t1